MPGSARTSVITRANKGVCAAAARARADRGDRVWGTAKKAELEACSPRPTIAGRISVTFIDIDLSLVEPGPFPSNLRAAARPPAREDVVASHGALGGADA
jgi:NAD(P)-dependent dehydrogenase (short-subunit alcohol dehydrogenase family)